MIEIVSEDMAGNRSAYKTEVVNLAVPSFDRVEIRPASMDGSDTEISITELEPGMISIHQGETIKLTLIGIDESGTEYIMDEDNVEWNFLMGQEKGKFSDDGVLEAIGEGEMVVKASYAISASYAWEDAIVVDVKSTTEPTDPDEPSDPDEPGDSGDTEDPGYPNEPGGSNRDDASSDIDQEMHDILENLITSEKNVDFIGFAQLSEHDDTVIEIDESVVLTIFKQDGLEEVGVGYGKVNDNQNYLHGSLQLYSKIYEIKLYPSVDFEHQPRLSFHLSLEETLDLEKLKVYWYNEKKQRWEYIGGTYHADEKSIGAYLPHFSKYALIYHPSQRLFTDVSGRWSEDMVYRLSSIGVVDGFMRNGKWVYDPQGNVSRQEFIKLLVAASELELSNADIEKVYRDHDAVSEWAVPYMATALEEKWLQGVERDGQLWLDPQRSITRAEAAAFIARMLSESLTESEGSTSSFNDDARHTEMGGSLC